MEINKKTPGALLGMEKSVEDIQNTVPLVKPGKRIYL
jgi:hypothetical protein